MLCGPHPWIPSVPEVLSNPAAGFLLVKQYLIVQAHRLLEPSSSLPATQAGPNTQVIGSLTLGLPSQRTQIPLYMILALAKPCWIPQSEKSSGMADIYNHAVDGPRAIPDSQNVGSIYFVKCGIKNASYDIYSPSQLHAEADNLMLVNGKTTTSGCTRKNMSCLSSWLWLSPLNRMSWAPVLTFFFFDGEANDVHFRRRIYFLSVGVLPADMSVYHVPGEPEEGERSPRLDL